MRGFSFGRSWLRMCRTRIEARLSREPALRLMEPLLRLPLGFDVATEYAAFIETPTALGLVGPPASGRSLALMQLAAHWVAHPSDRPLLYLALGDDDLLNLPPRAVLARAAYQAGLPEQFVAHQRPGLLLLDDWEVLALPRRAIWQQFLVSAQRTWPTLRIALTLPLRGAWDGVRLRPLALPTETTIAQWLAHLLPTYDLAPLLAALHGAPLAPVRESLAELALLALIYPIGGIPSSRAALYAQAYALAEPLLTNYSVIEVAGTGPSRNGRMLHAGVAVGRLHLRSYEQARVLADADPHALTDLPVEERTAVAALSAGLRVDPVPLFEMLARETDDFDNLRALVACVREMPTYAPGLHLRLVEYLTAAGTDEERQALLVELAPVLPVLFAAAAAHDEARTLAAMRATAPLLTPLPTIWLELGGRSGVPSALRRLAADLLIDLAPTPELLAEVAPDAPDAAYAFRAYVAACVDGATRQLLALSPLREGCASLLNDETMGTQRTRAALALLDDPAVPEELRALALACANRHDLVEEAAVADAPILRRAALQSLANEAPSVALLALTRVLLRPEATRIARREVLDALAVVPHPGRPMLLARICVSAALPLITRLDALDVLARQGAPSIVLLRRLLARPGLPLVVRVRAAEHLAARGLPELGPTWVALLTGDAPALVKRVAALALGDVGAHPASGASAAIALRRALQRAILDPRLASVIVEALGKTGDRTALSIFTALLVPSFITVLEAHWQRVAPELAQTPALAWPDLPLPPPVQRILAEALADNPRLAHPATRFAAMVEAQAGHLALAAISGMAHLAHTVGMREQVVTALRRALWAEQRRDVAQALLITLARLRHPAEELGALLQATELDLRLRLMALEWLGGDPAVQRMLGERLVLQRDEPAIRAAMLEQLSHPAIPTTVVGARARDPGEDPLVRYAAIAALGRSVQYEAQMSLLGLVRDPAEADEIRLAALEALPATLMEASMKQLRQLFHQHQEGVLAPAMARVLARNRDATGLACLLEAVQSASGPAMLAILDVLRLLDDPQITPVLTRLSQHSAVAPALRLAALATLLRRGEQDVLPLLQRYLTDPSPPVRVQAYTLLEEFAPANLRLEDPLDDPDAPLVLRLKALSYRAERTFDADWLCALTGKSDQPLALRLAAITALAHATEPSVVVRLEALLHLPQGLPDHPLPIIRRQCQATLGCLAQGEGACAEAALTTLARLSCEEGPVAGQRSWATEVLLEAMG
ncbi:hypothetical protein [Candidatus Chloroploca sp. Khr17]|uniref:hypothetical protein n=1 Tax=Candidatus Chloroploca sp. Khr17 TaxID=2496869 RepID=UPI00101D976D|nr:hypothetical protein [Candidatus Chloroploca sp. Khr17]